MGEYQGTLLVHGGEGDPDICRLVEGLGRQRVPFAGVLLGETRSPPVRWHLGSDRLEIAGQEIVPTAAFIRYCASMSSGPPGDDDLAPFRAQAWYATWHGWITAHPGVRTLNRGYGLQATNKPEHLLRARTVGLAIPDTWVTNHLTSSDIAAAAQRMAKPIAGGGYTHPLEMALPPFPVGSATLPAPAIIHQRLVAPEVRIFVVGGRTFAFEVTSSPYGYSDDADTEVHALPMPEGIAGPLVALTSSLGLDFAAAHFKTDPTTGRLAFLELDAHPAFATFDQATEGALVDAIVDWLTAAQPSLAGSHPAAARWAAAD